MKKTLAIDVGGTEIKYGLIDQSLQIINTGTIKTPNTNFDDFKNEIKNIYDQYKEEINGIAMSLPGFIDDINGKVLGGGALEYNIGRNVVKDLNEVCPCKIVIENDGKCAAIAEYRSGCLKETHNSAVFIIGTGVGGGLIINDQLVKGRYATAGEFSFLIMYHKGFHKQNEDIMGEICSTTGLLNLYKEYTNDYSEINGKQFFEKYHSGDLIAHKALDEFSEAVAIQVFNLGALLNVEKVAIGGGISRQPILIKKIKEKLDGIWLNQLCGLDQFNPFIPDIEVCKYGSEANLVGAYYAFLDRL